MTYPTHQHVDPATMLAAHLRADHGWSLKMLREAGFGVPVRGYQRNNFDRWVERLEDGRL